MSGGISTLWILSTESDRPTTAFTLKSTMPPKAGCRFSGPIAAAILSGCRPVGRTTSAAIPSGGDTNIIMLNIDLLLMKKTLQQVRDFVQTNRVCSVPGLTFMSSLSDSNGNVLHIVPGRGFKYYEKPDYQIMTNFPPFVPTPLQHPWMGLDRYQKAESMLAAATDEFDVDDCFCVLKEVSQTVCPTVISMVYDVTEKTVYWCYDRNYSRVESKRF